MDGEEPTVGQLVWAYIFGLLGVTLIGYIGYALNSNAPQNIVSGPYIAIFLGLLAGVSTGSILTRMLSPNRGLGLAAGFGGYTVFALMWTFYGGLIPQFLGVPASPTGAGQFASSSFIFFISVLLVVSGDMSGLLYYNHDVADIFFLVSDLIFPAILLTIWLVQGIILPLVEERKFLLVILVLGLTIFITYLIWIVLEGMNTRSSSSTSR